MQIKEEADAFAKVAGLKTLCVYGGASKWGQGNLLQQGIDILVATPGRLLDFINSGDTNMNKVSYLVLDEADRMLDMGFEKDIRKIVSGIKDYR
jgi:ATP-dependent RNA helicase DDX5/DBP2